MVGTRVDQFEFVSALGAGGMGEVYQAFDHQLRRDVAIKVLATGVDVSVQGLARLKREARAVASLNHPNIAMLYEIHRHGDQRFLVMELVKGESLAQTVRRRQLTPREVIDICQQIADAMSAAHERGVVHRDLKPANVMLTPDNTVKVLDFGVAKVAPPSPISGVPDAIDTQSVSITRPGTTPGTPSYMSPEQARGMEVDKRSDIWAFGCVMYELLTGHRAFEGATISETIAAILSREANWQRLPPDTPRSVVRLLRRCLQKDARHRLRDIGDAWLELREIDAQMGSDSATRFPTIPRWLLAPAAFAAVLALGWLAWMASHDVGPTPTETMRATLMLRGESLTLPRGPAALALTHDGKHLIYVARRDGATQLIRRSLSSDESTPIAGTEGGFGPFVSPDDQWVGFFSSDSTLQKVPLAGGSPIMLASAPVPLGASWAVDGFIYFTPTVNSGIRRVAADGGESELVTTPAEGDDTHAWPSVVAGGRALLYTVVPEGTLDASSIAALSLDTGKQQTVVRRGTDGRYSTTGHMIYIAQGQLMAVPFDSARLQVTGAPLQTRHQVQVESNGAAHYALASNGTLIYAERVADRRQLVLARQGQEHQPVSERADAYHWPRLSPDGRSIAVAIGDFGNSDVWLLDRDRAAPIRLTTDGYQVTHVWEPGGAALTVSSVVSGETRISSLELDGNRTGLLTSSPNLIYPTSWTADGQTLAFTRVDPVTGYDIWVMQRGEQPTVFVETPFKEIGAAFSGNGERIAYYSNISGRDEVYLSTYPKGRRVRVSSQGGSWPRWSADGATLFYTNGRALMAVSVTPGQPPIVGEPRIVLQGDFLDAFDVGREDEFFVVRSLGESERDRLRLILNWTGGL